MMIRNCFQFLILAFCMSACQSASKTAEADLVDTLESKAALQIYQPKSATITIKGSFASYDSLRIEVFLPAEKDSKRVWKVDANDFLLTVDSLNHHEVVNVSIESIVNRGLIMTDQHLAPISLWVVDGAVYHVDVQKLKKPITQYEQDYFTFARSEDEDHNSFLDLYEKRLDALDIYSNTARKVNFSSPRTDLDRTIFKWSEMLKEVDQSYIRQGKFDASSLYLIFNTNDHRKYQGEYRNLLENLSPPLKASRYGVDLNNRLEVIAHPPKFFDIDRYLQAVNHQMIPFDHQVYADSHKWVLVFWNSKSQEEQDQMAELKDYLSANPSQSGVQVLLMSLDSRLSRWREVTDKLQLKDSYSVRAGQRANLLQDWYLNTTPRIMVIEPNGKILQDDLLMEEIEQILAP